MVLRVSGWALTNQLHNAGFDVFDETAVTLENFAQGRVRRTDAELIDIAKSIHRPPIDVVVMFSIYADAHAKRYTTKARARIQGRLLNVKTGQRLGNIEMDYPGGWNAPVNCDRDCILNSVGQNAVTIANDVGAILVEKLAWMVNRSEINSPNGIMAYELIFDGFTPNEMMTVEEYLLIFSGYQSHRVTYSGATRMEFWYKSDSRHAKLNRNLHKVMESLGMPVVLQASGNTITVKKISLRGQPSLIDPSDW